MPWPLHATRITAEVRLDGVAVITLRKPLSGAVSVPVAVDSNPPSGVRPGHAHLLPLQPAPRLG
jgi:hypothetical protein